MPYLRFEDVLLRRPSLLSNIPRISQNKLDVMLGDGIETIDQLLNEEEHLENLTPKQRTYVAGFAKRRSHNGCY